MALASVLSFAVASFCSVGRCALRVGECRNKLRPVPISHKITALNSRLFRALIIPPQANSPVTLFIGRLICGWSVVLYTRVILLPGAYYHWPECVGLCTI